MDPHKLTRGKLLDEWIKNADGTLRSMLIAGGVADGRPLHVRESHYAQMRLIGMGHAAATRVERELEVSGMMPGTLTDRLDMVDLSERGLKAEIQLRNKGVIPDDTAATSKHNNPLKQGAAPSHDLGGRVTYLPVVPELEWGAQGVEVEVQDQGFELLALPQQVTASARRLAFPDDSFAPEIQRGDIVVVEYGATPLPNDIVLCRSEHLGVNFPGRYIQGMDGRAHIELNQPGFDSRVSADNVQVLAVVMYFLVGRKGRRP